MQCLCGKTWVLNIYMGNQNLQFENQMVGSFHLGASEILGVIWGDAGFTPVSVCAADSNNLYEYFVAGTFSTKSNICG